MLIQNYKLCCITMEVNTELRKLPPSAVFGLVRILETGNAWKQLMAIAPRSRDEFGDSFVPKYKVEHMKLIEQAGVTQRRPCAEIFLEEWGTSGRIRPDLAYLVQLLGKAQLFRAADYVTDLLKVPPLERPTTGPAALIDVSEESMEKKLSKLPPGSLELRNHCCQYNTFEINRAFDEMTIPDNSLPSLDGQHMQTLGEVMQEGSVVPYVEGNSVAITRRFKIPESDEQLEQETLPVDLLERSSRNTCLHQDTLLPHVQYFELECFTNYFNELSLASNGGRKLGAGAFGSVYLGILPSQKHVAVKRLHRDAGNVEKQFCNEIQALSRYRHSNLLCLVGYSCDGPAYCLIYEYMSNGSLQDRLACKHEGVALQWHVRLNIALGTARGILYLHTAYEKPLIHRDVKSANILLDQHLVPKLGDFGLVRLGQHSNSMTVPTTTVLGTSAYMAPEAFRGDVSVKLDTFSFGVLPWYGRNSGGL
ncbi:probable LRR receptor-like serine/threonine-protein kinase At1g51810 isoform X3 [Zootermopsis nevadensis]|uniref:probable LRR receptor-like serine/threonine-protein kinase At1g51810 isoform X3 n=1 Tax=Zootermopsis nevadensis TaxID=136037 RepID=UPI000B8E23AA|nr:probable LRR receptor-like serine/threonine-protein kinase At1g51810 isoform X3 [Zootermopsis nevadensis]